MTQQERETLEELLAKVCETCGTPKPGHLPGCPDEPEEEPFDASRFPSQARQAELLMEIQGELL